MINARAVRDIVAVVLYVGLLGGQMWIWAWWQNRGKHAVPRRQSNQHPPMAVRW